MLTIRITRHGETQWNKEKRMQSWQDSDLTEKGIENAKLLGQKLDGIDIDAIYCSPSGRTKETAAYICNGSEIPIYYDDRLKEINLVLWEGKTLTAIKEQFPAEFDAFWNAPHLYQPCGGETFEEVLDRSNTFLSTIKHNYQSGHLLIVTHTVVMKSLFCLFKNRPIKDLWESPYIHDTCLTVVELSDEYKLLLEADLSHLCEMEKSLNWNEK